MRKAIENSLYGFVILSGIALTAICLNHFFGVGVACIYVVLSIISMVLCLYELHHTPLLTDEDLSTKIQ